MSLAPSIPSIKVKVGGVSVAPPHRAYRASFAVIRSSKAEGPIRRPAAPPLSPPPPMPPKTPALSTPPTLSQSPTPVKPAAPTSSEQPRPPPEQKPVEAAAPAAAVQKPVAGAVTLEYQRKVAKDLQEYFKQKKLEEADQGPFFGFLPKNEISNGRWAMFGFAVGMLTEYATGSDFVQQMKILLSNFGIVDLD
ncbi:classical arabinogalactan protein 9 [Panicum miliaceum]|uniref:Classical arabinogalactan protein 9 n=1 Tax=Panicum miliaceum TaxID=4540 RepID=A0A3L6R349_PANMI|nr:classical arabinogalactan protein 9 [Panicum miliaceum]